MKRAVLERASAKKGGIGKAKKEGGESTNVKKPRHRVPKVCPEAWEEICRFIEVRPLVMDSLRNTRAAKKARTALMCNPDGKKIWDKCDWPFEWEANNLRNAMDVVITVLSYCLETETFVKGDNRVCPEWLKGNSNKTYIIPEKEKTLLLETFWDAVNRIKSLGEEFYKKYEVDRWEYCCEKTSSAVFAPRKLRGKTSFFGDAWIIAANVVRRVRTTYERRDELRQKYYKDGYVCCPDIFFLDTMADCAMEANILIEKNKGQSISQLECSTTLFREGFTKGTASFLEKEKNINQLHWTVTVCSIEAVVEYVTGCCVFDGSPFKNKKDAGDAMPQLLHMDVEYAKRIPVVKNPIDIGYAIADELEQRKEKINEPAEVDCVYDYTNVPTKDELECMTEGQMLTLMRRCMAGKKVGKVGARRSVKEDYSMRESEIYKTKPGVVRYMEKSVKDLKIDDSVASAVTSFFSKPRHEMDFPMLVLIPGSHVRVVYPREYDGKIDEFEQDIITMEQSKLVATPFMWTTVFNSLLWHGSGPTYSASASYCRWHMYCRRSGIAVRETTNRQLMLNPELESLAQEKSWWSKRVVDESKLLVPKEEE